MNVMTPKATSCLRGTYVYNLSHYSISYNFKKKILKGADMMSKPSGNWLGIT